MRHLYYIPCLLAVLPGCGSRSPERTSVSRAVVEYQHGRTIRYDFSPESGVSADSVRVPPSVAWRAMPEAYAKFELGITPDSNARVVTSTKKSRRTLAGTSLSRIVECGSPLGVKRADHYTVTLSVATLVDSVAPAVSVLRTRVQATAFDVAGNSNVVTCASTGHLEAAIADAVQKLAS